MLMLVVGLGLALLLALLPPTAEAFLARPPIGPGALSGLRTSRYALACIQRVAAMCMLCSSHTLEQAQPSDSTQPSTQHIYLARSWTPRAGARWAGGGTGWW